MADEITTMREKIAQLEKENARYKQEINDAENMLAYERNKFERQLQEKEAGIAEQLSNAISLEIQALHEIIEYIEEDDRRRIQRRLLRIGDILKEFANS